MPDLGDAAQAGSRTEGYPAARQESCRRRFSTPLLRQPQAMRSTRIASPRDPRGRIPDWLETEVARWTPDEAKAGTGVDWRNVMERLIGGFESVLVHGDAIGCAKSTTCSSSAIARPRPPVVDPAALDGSDDAASRTGSAVTLPQHLARCSCPRCTTSVRASELPTTPLVDDLRLAAEYHDIGKIDPRFQAQLVGGDEVALAMLDEPLAKSVPGTPRVRGYPVGMRHELASVALLESDRTVLASQRTIPTSCGT